MTEKTPVEIVRCAREFLADEKRWVKGASAVFADGASAQWAWRRPLEPAFACCLWGAMARCVPEVSPPTYDDSPLARAADAVGAAIAARTVGGKGNRAMVTVFNDDPATTHADVLAVLDAAEEGLSQ